MSFRRPALLIALAGALCAVALSGCGASPGATIDPVAEAAVATTHAGGAHMAMHISIDLQGLAAPLTVAGSGDFNFSTDEGEIISNLTGLPAAATSLLHGSSLEFTELYAKGDLYMSSPLFDGKLPDGARWMKLDLSQLAAGAGIDAQSLTSGQSDPAEVLNYLRAGGTIRKVGSERLRGTPTTRYRGSIDLLEAAQDVPGSNHAQAKAAIEKLIAQTGTRKLPVEVWVDSHGLVRKLTMALTEVASGEHVNVAIELELFDFGATPSVNPPAAGEVFDATQSSLDALSGAGL
jgi:hypothetical protein